VESTWNNGASDGTNIDASYGSGNVSVSSSVFSNNTEDGLEIKGNGTITLNKVTAKFNSQSGVMLSNFLVVTPKAVTVNDLNVDQNFYYGVNIASKGNVTLNNLSADGMVGGTDAVSVVTSGNVTIGTNGTFQNTIIGNPNNGLIVVAGGAIALKNISVSSQSLGFGTLLDNLSGAGGVTVINGVFNSNRTDGLTILTNGAILLTNVSASANQRFGAILNNSSGPGGVIINGATTTSPNEFSDNFNDGLNILTKGAVSLANIRTNKNDNLVGNEDGMEINTSLGNVTLTNITANNNGASGITIYAGNGTITLSNVAAHGNKTWGTYLDNSTTLTPKTVSVKNFSSEETVTNEGLFINSAGNVLLTTIGIGNAGGIGGLYVDNSFGSAPSSITLSAATGKINAFGYNRGYGMLLISDGVISLSAIESYKNYYDGIYARNYNGLGSITLLNSITEENGGAGVSFNSAGAITIKGLTSIANGFDRSGGWGIGLYNSFGVANISVSSSVLSNNYSGGMAANSLGAIAITNSVAEGNVHNQGFDLVGNKTISILSTGGFKNLASGNYSENVRIVSGADVVIQNLLAGENTSLRSVDINNTSGTGKVTINGIEVREGPSGGLKILTNGAISISNAIASDNTGIGIELDNSTGTGSVIFSNVNASNNSSIGIWIFTKGNTILDKVNANANSSSGVQIDITDLLSTLTINRSRFDGNAINGISTFSGGNVVVNGVSASSNSGGNGFYIHNQNGVGTVTILTTYGPNNFSKNGLYGLYVYSTGSFKGSNISANDNGYIGAYIFNSFGTGGATITGGNFNRNNNSGLYIFTTSDIVINNVVVTGNGKTSDVPGISLVNNGNITLANSITSGNGKEGIYASGSSISTILISKSFFFGNNRFAPYDGDPNISIGSGYLMILR
jgi:hypothetical protein